MNENYQDRINWAANGIAEMRHALERIRALQKQQEDEVLARIARFEGIKAKYEKLLADQGAAAKAPAPKPPERSHKKKGPGA